MKGTLNMVRTHRAAREAAWLRNEIWMSEPLIHLVERGVAASPGTKLIFSSAERASETTAGKILAGSKRVAAGLRTLGLREGDVIVSQTPHWEEGVQLLLAALHLGIIVVPVIHIYGANELAFLLCQSKAKALILPDQWSRIDYAARIAQMGPLPNLVHIIVIGHGAMPRPVVRWSDLINRGEVSTVPAATQPDDICAITFTSGTTSAPKGVMHSQRGLAAEVRQSSIYIDRARAAAVLVTSPAGHIGGLSASLRPFLSHEDAVFLDRWELDRALLAMADHEVTRGICTPFHLNALIESKQVPKSFKQTIVGAASVSPALVERAQAAGITAYRCWGCTEHPTVTTSRAEDTYAARAFTDGAIMQGCAIRIVDDEERILRPGMCGEIQSMGPELFEGYLDPALNDAAFTADGWYRTGDVGVLDDNGRLTIVDRKKDIIIRGGENISSKEVEDVLTRHPRITAAAAVAWPDPIYGERVAAFVQLNDASRIEIPDLIAHFDACGVARQKTPERLIVVKELPRNALGKILKHELRARARALSASDSWRD
jgi:acyl-CoA synthetase (AMP-forming)/AMP-acid ligase II